MSEPTPFTTYAPPTRTHVMLVPIFPQRKHPLYAQGRCLFLRRYRGGMLVCCHRKTDMVCPICGRPICHKHHSEKVFSSRIEDGQQQTVCYCKTCASLTADEGEMLLTLRKQLGEP